MNYCFIDENRNFFSVFGEVVKCQRKKCVSSFKVDYYKFNMMDFKRICYEGLRKIRRNIVLFFLNIDMRY